MKLSSSTELVKPFGCSLVESVVLLKKFGFEAIDFGLTKDYSGYSDNDFDKMLLEVKKQADESKIEIFQTHLPYYDFAHGLKDSKEDSVKKAIRGTQLLGAKYAVLHPANTRTPEEDGKEMTIDYFKPHIEYAKSLGVEILIENMPSVNYGTAPHRYCVGAKELLEAADELKINVCWDFGHPNVSGYCLDQTDDLLLVGERLKVVHINDNYAVGYDEHLAPYCGNINWDAILKALKKINYNGTFNYEILPRHMPASAVESFAAFLVDIGKKMIKEIEA